MIQSSCRGGFEFLRQSNDSKICAIFVKHSLYKEVAADENVTRHSFAKLTKTIGNSHHFVYNRHVAILAGLLPSKITVVPFLIRHLLWKFADLLTSGTQS